MREQPALQHRAPHAHRAGHTTAPGR
jgi:hypothetical protein